MAIPLDWTVLLPAVIGVAVLVQYLTFKQKISEYPTPPQPPGWPLIGNIGQMPKKFAWLKFIEWGKELSKWIPIVTTFTLSHGPRLRYRVYQGVWKTLSYHQFFRQGDRNLGQTFRDLL